MEICDYAEKRLIEPPLIIQSEGTVTIKQDIRAVAANMDRQFNKTAYMRDYMRKRRARTNPNGTQAEHRQEGGLRGCEA